MAVRQPGRAPLWLALLSLTTASACSCARLCDAASAVCVWWCRLLDALLRPTFE